MTHRLRRPASLLTSLLIVATALATAATSPASADGHPLLTVRAGEVVTEEYDSIPGNFPIAPDVNPWPNECANEFRLVCDSIPLDVELPRDLGANDVVFLTVQLDWLDAEEGTNDLDLYLWDDRQIERNAGEEDPVYTEINRSTTAGGPEEIKQIFPDLGRYNLTIVNWSGPSLGYTVKAFLTVAEFEAPFELLAPEFGPPAEEQPEEDVVVPFDYSATPPSNTGGPMTPTFGELPVQPDASLDFGPSDFDQAIAAPPRPFTPSSRLSQRPPRPVPGAVAAFWFGAVPLVLVGAAVLLVARRRRDAFAYA